MKLIASQDVHSLWAVMLHDLTPNAIVEVRIQNTMNGKQIEQYIESNGDGIAEVDLPDFGQQYAITIRELANNNAEVLHRLHFDVSDDVHRLTMSSIPEPITKASNGALQEEVTHDV